MQHLLTVAWGHTPPGPVPHLFDHTACAVKQACLERAELRRTRLTPAGYARVLVIVIISMGNKISSVLRPSPCCPSVF